MYHSLKWSATRSAFLCANCWFREWRFWRHGPTATPRAAPCAHPCPTGISLRWGARIQPAKQTGSRPPGSAPIIDAGQQSVSASLPITRRKYTDEDPHTTPVRPRTSSAIHAATGPFSSLSFPTYHAQLHSVQIPSCMVFLSYSYADWMVRSRLTSGLLITK